MRYPTVRTLTLASAVSLPMLATAVAQDEWETWGEMSEQVVSAEDVLDGNVNNGLNAIGNVRDLVLSAEGDRVEFIMMEVPYPWSYYGGEDGFVAFDRVDFQRGPGLDVDVVIERDEPVSPPEELTLTATEAENRLVSRLIGQRVRFSEGSREVTDMLIDRDSGVVTHWIVEMAEDALFSTDRRAIPADQISIEEGTPSTQIEVATLDEYREYDSQFL